MSEVLPFSQKRTAADWQTRTAIGELILGKEPTTVLGFVNSRGDRILTTDQIAAAQLNIGLEEVQMTFTSLASESLIMLYVLDDSMMAVPYTHEDDQLNTATDSYPAL